MDWFLELRAHHAQTSAGSRAEICNQTIFWRRSADTPFRYYAVSFATTASAMTKAYIAGHDVYYSGFREGKGVGIMGIAKSLAALTTCTGRAQATDYESAEEPAPVETVATEVCRVTDPGNRCSQRHQPRL